MDVPSFLLAFRISASVTGTRFSRDYFESLWNWRIWRADEHYPKFMSLICGDQTVDEVLEGKEKPQLRLVEKSEEQRELFEEDGAGRMQLAQKRGTSIKL